MLGSHTETPTEKEDGLTAIEISRLRPEPNETDERYVGEEDERPHKTIYLRTTEDDRGRQVSFAVAGRSRYLVSMRCVVNWFSLVDRLAHVNSIPTTEVGLNCVKIHGVSRAQRASPSPAYSVAIRRWLRAERARSRSRRLIVSAGILRIMVLVCCAVLRLGVQVPAGCAQARGQHGEPVGAGAQMPVVAAAGLRSGSVGSCWRSAGSVRWIARSRFWSRTWSVTFCHTSWT